MSLLRYLLVVCCMLARLCCAQKFYLIVPNVLRLDSHETVAIAVDGSSSLVSVYIQDYPGKIKNLTQTVLEVRPGHPEIFKINLSPSSFPRNFFSSSAEKFVFLIIHSQNFHKEIPIPISHEAGYVFIQTDKPIYTPKDRVHMRIISLNEDTLPSNQPFKLQIKNPKGIVIEEKKFDKKPHEIHKVFASHIFKFPNYPVLGEWSASVYYGFEMQQNETVRFELDEYVLPTFTVELKTPDVILESHEIIDVTIHAKYVYGKKVNGMVTFRLGVKPKDVPHVIFFAVVGPKDLRDGSFKLRLKTQDISNHKDIGWFPEIEEAHLVVEASVTDVATGNKEVVTDSKSRFSKSPFEISFKRCLSDFKPGLMSIFEADVNYVGGKPAAGVPMRITALADGEALKVTHDTAISDEEGKVSFQLHPELQHKMISITLQTEDDRFGSNQATGHHVQNKFVSEKNAYIALDRTSNLKLKLKEKFVKLVYFEPEDMSDFYYVVVSKGKVVKMDKLPKGRFKMQKVEFEITHEMVPAFRIVVFSEYKGTLLADSLNIDIEDSCHPGAEVTLKPEFSIKEPGNGGTILIEGKSGTMVGLLGIDEAVYALSKKDILTKNKIFKTFAKHDLGCGPGGGITTENVLSSAGILIASDFYSPPLQSASSCVAIKRRKRAIANEKVQTFISPLEKECCSLGLSQDKFNRDCEVRTNIVARYLNSQFEPGKYENCSRVFLECCLHAKDRGVTDMKAMRSGMVSARMGTDIFDVPEFISVEDEDFWEKGVTIRSIFWEQWFFEDLSIGLDGKKEFQVSLPHSITTWVISAVAVSPHYGICMAEPQKIVSFKKAFLHLNLPYSVVRNEQIEIQATLFNYGDRRLSAVLYMYGVKDLCTGANEGEKSERKRLIVERQSAQSVTFPVIPLQAGAFDIKVVALSPEGSDVIQRKLNVVPEGYPVEVDIPIKLDPTNQQKRQKRHITTDTYSDSIDSSQNLQVTAIKLPAPKNFVPGTESCTITALGDSFGPIVETALNNPENLLQLPRGCGEQNMIYFAPTLYTMRYLKVKGKITPDKEEKGYSFIRTGYANQISFRKSDGSYAAWANTPTSTWLTAFTMKVLCQANELVHIDEHVLCSGLKWLQDHQEADGSYDEPHPVYHIEMVGGVQGKVPMTAFALIALEECKCDDINLLITKKRAVAFLEEHLAEVNTPLAVAIVAYALALSDSVLKHAANDRLMSMSKYHADTNTMYWGSGDSATDIEATSYALLNQLLFNNVTRGNSIVNWLNTQQLQSGSFKSTQDTVVGLQALSEFAIKSQMPTINLVANISSSNDRNFQKVLNFREDNAHILQDVKVDKIGGMIFINTAGHGMGSLAVKLRYNLPTAADKPCKFDMTVNVTEEKEQPDSDHQGKPGGRHDVFDFGILPPDLIRGVADSLDADEPALMLDPRNRGRSLVPNAAMIRSARRLKRKAKLENSKLILKVSLCARYLGHNKPGMSIIDAGIFSGFIPNEEDLKELRDDPAHLIERYEVSSRGVVFYLKTVPTVETYCFDFHITRQFIVGNTQTSVVKIYDYYNPDDTCTKFYSPGSNSPILHKLCEGGVCQCAEGGCPPKNPFEVIRNLDRVEKKDKLLNMACEDYDYVWIGQLAKEIRKEAGFYNIDFEIQEVIKEGIEKVSMLEGDVRTFLARDNCQSAELFSGPKYLIMGRDGQAYKNDKGVLWRRYLLDKTSAIHLMTEIKDSKDPELQRALKRAIKDLKTKGCAL